MHKSPTSSRASSHHTASSAGIAAAAAAAAAVNLPFSIDHILSSTSSMPMKQAVHQAMSGSHEQHPLQTQLPQLHQHQQSHLSRQQQAAANFINQAATSHQQQSAPNHDIVSSAAMFNEQIAMLAAAQHQHLLNPTALAAVQHQLHQQQQWQQQQQAMAIVHQQLQTMGSGSSLSALNSLNPLTGQAHSGAAASGMPNDLLSYFMASMLIQQQQQQQQKQSYQIPSQDPQQHPLLSQHQHRTSGMNPAAFLSPLVEQHHQSTAIKSIGPNHTKDLFATQFKAAAAAAAAMASSNNQLRSPSNTSSSSNSTNSQVKQFFGNDPSVSANNNNNLNQNNSSARKSSSAFEYDHSSGNKRSPFSPVSNQNHNQTDTTTNVASGSSGNIGNKRLSRDSQRAPAFETARQMGANSEIRNGSVAGNRQQSKPSGSKTIDPKVEIVDVGVAGTALSSLTNFVSNSLAPIFGDELGQSRNLKRSPSSGLNHQRLSSSDNGQHQKVPSRSGLDTSNNNGDYSGNESSHEDDKSSLASSTTRISSSGASKLQAGSGLLNAVSSALKSSPTTTVASTINTTLAKAPPELVQKQPAWVFCTRYSDRPSSGPRTRRAKSKEKKAKDTKLSADEKRPRTAFTSEQLQQLRKEFQANSYLDQKRRESLAKQLELGENQIKIWFQNKRAKMKKQSNQPNPLRGLLVAGGLYNHSTATSDCSESYANGLADDIGNRAMKDVEPDDGGGHDHDDGNAMMNNNNDDDYDDEDEVENHANKARLDNIDRFEGQTIRTLKSLNDRSSGVRLAEQRDQDNGCINKQQVTDDRSVVKVETLKRRPTGQSDGDDEAEDDTTGRNSSSGSHLDSNVIKRTKLNHMDRNHGQRLSASHANLSRTVLTAGDFGPASPTSGQAMLHSTSSTVDNLDEDEEPVISVS